MNKLRNQKKTPSRRHPTNLVSQFDSDTLENLENLDNYSTYDVASRGSKSQKKSNNKPLV